MSGHKFTSSLNWSVKDDLTHLEPLLSKEQDKQSSPAAQTPSDEQSSPGENGRH